MEVPVFLFVRRLGIYRMKESPLFVKDVCARLAAREHHQRPEIDLRVLRLRRLGIRAQQVNQLRHDLEFKLALLPAVRTRRNRGEIRLRVLVRPEDGVVVPTVDAEYLEVGTLDDFVEVETHGIIFESAAERVADILVRQFYGQSLHKHLRTGSSPRFIARMRSS